MTDRHDHDRTGGDLSAELNLRALRGESWLSAGELTGLLRGDLSGPGEGQRSPELRSLLSLAPLAHAARDPESLQALILVATRLEDTNTLTNWLDLGVNPARLRPDDWLAAGRLIICADAVRQLAGNYEPDAEPVKLMRRLMDLTRQLTDLPNQPALRELGFTRAELQLVWPELHTDALTYAGPGTQDAPPTPQARRWQQALYPTDQVHLLNVTLYAQRPAQDEDHHWPAQQARTGAELAALMKGLTDLQGDLSGLSGEPDREPDFTQVQRLILPAISPRDPDGSLMVSTLLVLAALPWTGTWLTAAMSRAMPDPDDELGGLKHTLNLLLPEMEGHAWAGRLATLRDLWPQLRRQVR